MSLQYCYLTLKTKAEFLMKNYYYKLLSQPSVMWHQCHCHLACSLPSLTAGSWEAWQLDSDSNFHGISDLIQNSNEARARAHTHTPTHRMLSEAFICSIKG